ncbi:MAG: ubiquinone/menaquinone biosynthesis methyltransferase [Candidatus Omnitrophica bacterium]|nr:ubiquinone/menaquinone biosynthesis methyltransferase [Candidatus Omnitrophota bacterium]
MTIPKPSSPSSPSAAGKDKASFVRTLFDQISPRYDLFNRLASFGLDQRWRRRAVAAAGLKKGMNVLDLGAGTGDLSLLAAQQVAPTGFVAALDVSPKMLQIAQQKAARAPWGYHVRTVEACAEELPFQDAALDAVLSAFVMRNVTDLAKTFQESHRVLKNGGKIVILEFFRPQSPLMRFGHNFWMMTGALTIGWLATGLRWPFSYLRKSIASFVPPKEFIAALEQSGFSQVTQTPLLGGAVMIYRGIKP